MKLQLSLPVIIKSTKLGLFFIVFKRSSTWGTCYCHCSVVKEWETLCAWLPPWIADSMHYSGGIIIVMEISCAHTVYYLFS